MRGPNTPLQLTNVPIAMAEAPNKNGLKAPLLSKNRR